MPVPVFLHGRSVRLEPLAEHHVEALAVAAGEDRGDYSFIPVPSGVVAAERYVADALAAQAAGLALPFATVRVADGLVVGATRFCELDYWQGPVIWPPAPRGPLGDPLTAVPDAAEIGGTWLSAGAQGTGINTEAKLLMLRHAFETWGVRRVSIRADARNTRSRAAIERLGAVLDGVHRAHTRGLDGAVRGTAFYSILDDEWPQVRARLEQRVAADSVADGERPLVSA
ncbi:GNAT family N-acetyltransferase [Streptantibioticus rubrisoli]|uniref:GNAT family N-acetyltransferase n=1 Tax=Streptantibioticus rubrisoli TaxID=1387313 RepID=A0ABT1P7M7_9ACTN|nr:GNAT family N-acetyltransferase [Streptantibioticus rubrisoli]MCQ4041380.1 GNAT family N-acetyltransferase [Streptantibioticus rubrisoli]